MTKREPIIIKSFPGQAVDAYLKKHGRLPNESRGKCPQCGGVVELCDAVMRAREAVFSSFYDDGMPGGEAREIAAALVPHPPTLHSGLMETVENFIIELRNRWAR